jgi:cyclin-dependent kinase 12/13
MDAKLRDEEARRLRVAGKSSADGAKISRTRDQAVHAMPAPEANAELQSNLDRRHLITHANAKSKSEKYPSPHQDGALGYPMGSAHPIDPAYDMPDVPFSSMNFSYPKAPIQTWSLPLLDPTTSQRKKKDSHKYRNSTNRSKE